MTPSLRVVLTGTDDALPTGGIAAAMAGYRAALEAAGVFEAHEPIHHGRSLTGRWWPAVRGIPRVVARVRAIAARGDRPAVYGHGGGPVSIQREVVVLAAARAAGARTLLQLHSSTLQGVVATAAGRAWLRTVLAVPHGVAVLTPHWGRLLEEAGYRGPIAVIPNPLSPDLEATARAGLSPDHHAGEALRVLVMTRLLPGKNVDVVLRAIAKVPGATAVIAGEGPERLRLEALARELGAAAEFPGWVSGPDKLRLLAQADVYCLPTTGDSFGLGFVEAMAHGTPVVAARWGPIPDVVPETAGVLVDRPEPDLVAAALESLRDPARRRPMGEAGQRHVLASFAAEAVAPRIVAAFG